MQVIGNHALTPKHDPEERVGLGTGAVLLVEVMEDDPTFHDDGKNEDDGSDDEVAIMMTITIKTIGRGYQNQTNDNSCIIT